MPASVLEKKQNVPFFSTQGTQVVDDVSPDNQPAVSGSADRHMVPSRTTRW
jgi:hypothetical protein